VGLKLGVYGIIRFILPIIPGVSEQWETFVLILGLISIFYGGSLALTQINVRRLLAFVALSHTGLIIIGVFSFNRFGLEGAYLLSVVYGLAAAGMFFSVGLVYERTRTSWLQRLGGLFDSHANLALLFLISILSTLIIPGTPGFDAAHLLIEGIIEEDGWFWAISILMGNVLAAVFLLRCFYKIFISVSRRSRFFYVNSPHFVREERIITVIICSLLIGTGFYTTPWLNMIARDIHVLNNQFFMHNSTNKNQKPESVNINGSENAE
jgi:NADH-quinone oxidoreductase subunit M